MPEDETREARLFHAQWALCSVEWSCSQGSHIDQKRKCSSTLNEHPAPLVLKRLGGGTTPFFRECSGSSGEMPCTLSLLLCEGARSRRWVPKNVDSVRRGCLAVMMASAALFPVWHGARRSFVRKQVLSPDEREEEGILTWWALADLDLPPAPRGEFRMTYSTSQALYFGEVRVFIRNLQVGLAWIDGPPSVVRWIALLASAG